MKRYLPFIIVAVVAIATLGSGAMLYRAKLPHPLTIPEDKSASGKGDAESMHIRGNANAPVTLEEFGDFQCPPCGSISGFLDELVKEYDPHLRIVFRNFPLSMHEHARDAAVAAEAAGLQGRFWDMHDVLYREQATWSKAENARELFDTQIWPLLRISVQGIGGHHRLHKEVLRRRGVITSAYVRPPAEALDPIALEELDEACDQLGF